VSNRDRNCIITLILIKQSIIRTRTNQRTQRKSRSIEGFYTYCMPKYRPLDGCLEQGRVVAGGVGWCWVIGGGQAATSAVVAKGQQ